jgi:L-lactate dehydrogenase complex protein LldF
MSFSLQQFDFHAASVQAAGDERLKAAINDAVVPRNLKRQERLAELPDSDALRTLAGDIKQHTLDNLDYYLEQLTASVEAKGGRVHFASDAQDAQRIIADIAEQAGCRLCVKSKSMASEEIELTPALEKMGLEVVETDLGEFIIQISHDRPSHIVAPVVHKTRASIAQLFSDYFHTPYNDEPVALTRQARSWLRDKFRRADMGITGGNFMVAESGDVCICTNEGNGRMTTAMPRVLVSLVGIEKVIPRMTDLAVLLKLLTRSATGHPITVYTSLFGGIRQNGEKDGPEEFHLVLLDNGRSEILAGDYRETLRCIRCGACLNACPVYRKIGGHAYGSVYSGPIGALITPLFKGLDEHKDLPQASSLCGACYEACPVKINIPQHLVNLRRDIARKRLNGFWERLTYRLWARSMRYPFLYRWINRLQRWDLTERAAATGWIEKMPSIAAGWTQIRDMPAPADQSFHEMWKKRVGG